MKKLLALFLLTLAVPAFAGTAFLQQEIRTGGFTKQCVYNYLGNTYVLTVSTLEICSLTITVSD
jgi:hypothetical protein